MSRLLYAAGRLRDISFTRRPEEDAPVSSERLGQPSRDRPDGYLLWLHADAPESAGAGPAVAHELARTRGENFATLITTAQTGSLAEPVARQAIHQLAPGDTAGSVARFLDHWRPDAAIMLGVPDRPRLLLAARDRGIPLFLAASERGSLASRRRLSLLSSDLLDCFDVCLAASAADAEVLHRHLGDGPSVEVAGPLSDTTFALPCGDRERDATARALKGRAVWLAADISANEIDAVDAAHRRAFRFAHRLLLVVIPAAPSDGQMMAGKFEEQGWKVGRSSVTGEPAEADQVFIADGEDAHGLWYRLAPTTFVGGTLDPSARPSDPFAPAALGSAVIHGTHVEGMSTRFQQLSKARASITVKSPEDLGAEVQLLLAPDKAAELAQAGWQVTTEAAQVVERLADLINAALDEKESA